jgi:G3E family GTPase
MSIPPSDIILITGYLGAGKTTLLKHLLRWPDIAAQRPALIINEFGQQGIDGRWFDRHGLDMFEINRGSLFCVCTKTDLLEALAAIARPGRPRLVLAEASGVAETRDIENLLDEPGVRGRFRVRGNLCVVDALNFTKVAAMLKAVRYQVAAADALIINKTDLADPATLPALTRLLAEINPRASQVTTQQADIEPALLQRLAHQRARDALAVARPEAIYAVTFRTPRRVDRAKFTESVRQLGDRLLRLKGHVQFADREGPEFVETVCGGISTGPPLVDSTDTAFTAIAFELPKRELLEMFQQTLVDLNVAEDSSSTV